MYGYISRAHSDRLSALRVIAEDIASHRDGIKVLEAEAAGIIAELRRPDRLSTNGHAAYDAPSWADIARELGVTKQAAQHKYGRGR